MLQLVSVRLKTLLYDGLVLELLEPEVKVDERQDVHVCTQLFFDGVPDRLDAFLLLLIFKHLQFRMVRDALSA